MIRLPLSAASVMLLAAACRPVAPVTAPQPAAPMPSREAAEAFNQVYRARKDSAMRRFTPADVEFMQGMIHHHAQALVMSRLAVPNGAGASVRTLAARIINAQSDEIEIMQTWLRARAQSTPELHEMNGSLMVHQPGGHGDHMAHMPGMLTDAQLDTLRAARGEAFDRLFLTFMIQHHKGAVTMVEALFARDGAGQDEAVFKFASDAQVDQGTEIARMEGMLAALGAATKRPPAP